MQEPQEAWVQSLGPEDPWRRKWQPMPVFLPGEFHGQRSLVGYSPQGLKESDTTEQLHFTSSYDLSNKSLALKGMRNFFLKQDIF